MKNAQRKRTPAILERYELLREAMRKVQRLKTLPHPNLDDIEEALDATEHAAHAFYSPSKPVRKTKPAANTETPEPTA